MKIIRLLLVASAAFFIGFAQAQTPGTVANHAVPVGKGAGSTGFSSAAPGASGIPLTSSGASSDPTFHPITNAGIAPGAANSTLGTLDGATTSWLTMASCSAVYQFTQWVSGTGWQCGITPVLPSRAVASGLNLSAFSAVETLGYAQPGDGGGAFFVKSASWFKDSFIQSLAITTTGSGCTNGTYYGVPPIYVSGTNLGHGALLKIVVAGGIVTSVTATTPGNQYASGDIYSQTTTSPGFTCSGSSPTFTVTPTTPTGSFTDANSNKWQIVVDKASAIIDRQFGAVKNYTAAGGDAGATNDQAAIQNAMYFAAFGVGSGDAGGFNGHIVALSQGASLVCGGLIIPTSVVLTGVAEIGSTLKECNSEANTQHFITLGDPQTHQTCFFNSVKNLTLFAGTGTISGNIAMVYSNCAQSNEAIKNVQIYPISRACVLSDTGYGGPSIFHISAMYCIPNNALTPFGVNLSSASNIVIDGGTWFSSGGTPWAGQSIIVNTNGVSSFRIQDVHIENIATGAYINTPAGGGGTMTHIIGMTGNGTVTNLINRVNGSVTGQLKVEDTAPNGSGCTVFNGAACATTGNVFGVTTY